MMTTSNPLQNLPTVVVAPGYPYSIKYQMVDSDWVDTDTTLRFARFLIGLSDLLNHWRDPLPKEEDGPAPTDT